MYKLSISNLTLNKKYPILFQNNYNIIEQIGDGAFSVVFKAIDLASLNSSNIEPSTNNNPNDYKNKLHDNNFVAIKIINKSQLNSNQKSLILKEVSILKKLNHKNIVKFRNFLQDVNYFYIIQELCHGGEIFNQIVNLTYLSEDLSRHVILQIAEALNYLHNEIGIVHRDIKPENLLFNLIPYTRSECQHLRKSDDPKVKKDEGLFKYGYGGGTIGIVKLADFGLSKQIWELKTKTPCGTVGYVAPEIVKDEKYSKKVDLWALGCVLYTLLCGFPPFYDDKIDVLTVKISKGEFEFLSPWWDEISNGAKNCVKNLLSVNPKQRYDIKQFFSDPWIEEYLLKLPKDSNGNLIYAVDLDGEYSTRYYSPSAMLLRDAFEISAALNRMNEEKANNRERDQIIEEDEDEEDEDIYGNDNGTNHIHNKKISFNNINKNNEPTFDLKIETSTLLERRRKKKTNEPIIRHDVINNRRILQETEAF
ncbi:Pkinase-domain-containing protein [Ascoidea rubescens DSM 1968]|uniref:Pkinase-domain-containing protein n=1 Tax=Ascoidea rubescens DSM 1968 TaxID=1344418 RepID=A0A1D2VEV3_9ASCO|nr:Pkinase-domain-containing protein [Ascoidea rubescens DSM 1968]ODV60050.1 Pkinase-domain-containing protein [Ascoidea rubescens DSM 1968]